MNQVVVNIAKGIEKCYERGVAIGNAQTIVNTSLVEQKFNIGRVIDSLGTSHAGVAYIVEESQQ